MQKLLNFLILCGLIIVLIFISMGLFSHPVTPHIEHSKIQSGNTINFTTNIPEEIEEEFFVISTTTNENDIIVYTEPNHVINFNSNLLDENEAYPVAIQILNEYGGLPKDASYCYYELVVVEKVNDDTNEVVVQIPVWCNLKFKRMIEGKPVVGPGGEIDVRLGDNGKMLGLVKIWRTLGEKQKVEIISTEEATALLLAGESINKLQYNGNITINTIETGYYEYGPDQKQTSIEPVWIFRGYDEFNSQVNLYIAAKRTDL